jgi:hypothetical protein
MSSTGIEGVYLETHNWGKTVAFWTGLGYELQFETDHHSGQLVHPDGGPYLFVNERPEHEALEVHIILSARDATAFSPPEGATVAKPFTAEHWDVMEMYLHDPDGRTVSVQAPLPEGVAAPPGHH